jgi:hypothetical protein
MTIIQKTSPIKSKKQENIKGGRSTPSPCFCFCLYNAVSTNPTTAANPRLFVCIAPPRLPQPTRYLPVCIHTETTAPPLHIFWSMVTRHDTAFHFPRPLSRLHTFASAGAAAPPASAATAAPPSAGPCCGCAWVLLLLLRMRFISVAAATALEQAREMSRERESGSLVVQAPSFQPHTNPRHVAQHDTHTSPQPTKRSKRHHTHTHHTT